MSDGLQQIFKNEIKFIDEEKLKPCPFCGSNPRWCGEDNKHPEDDHVCHIIVCDGCGISLDLDNKETEGCETVEELKSAVLKVWNMRKI